MEHIYLPSVACLNCYTETTLPRVVGFSVVNTIQYQHLLSIEFLHYPGNITHRQLQICWKSWWIDSRAFGLWRNKTKYSATPRIEFFHSFMSTPSGTPFHPPHRKTHGHVRSYEAFTTQNDFLWWYYWVNYHSRVTSKTWHTCEWYRRPSRFSLLWNQPTLTNFFYHHYYYYHTSVVNQYEVPSYLVG